MGERGLPVRTNILLPIGSKVRLKSHPRMPRPTWGLELEVLSAREDALTREKIYTFEHEGSRGEVNEDFIATILSLPPNWAMSQLGQRFHLYPSGTGNGTGGWTSPPTGGGGGGGASPSIVVIGGGGGGGSGRSRGRSAITGTIGRIEEPQKPQERPKTSLEEWGERNPGYDLEAMARMGRNWWE